MPAIATKGLDKPQARAQSFVGAWMMPETKKRFVGWCMLNGKTIQGAINEMVAERLQDAEGANDDGTKQAA